ncbi:MULTISPECIES: hypothetical protein [Streptomyces]|uniref:Uncharacterized protein n=2 Tax=Streptomyces TaxID=1883 RepID=A0ABU4KF24_9ACTN|nr:hypothetical protein [Streptomyces roseolus]MDX2296390.1 hypothetical protein [Streptomyces roseolus]
MSEDEDLGWQILRQIEKDHEWRVQNPEAFFKRLCDDMWRTTPDDEALAVFKIRVRNAAWWAIDAVECIEQVVAERPAWAPPILQEWADLWFGVSATEDPEPYFAWLAERSAELRAAVEEERRGPS